MTEMKGNYQIALDLSLEDFKAAAAKAGVAFPPCPRLPAERAAPRRTRPGPRIFSSIEQLGLKLESKKAPVESVIVDSAEKRKPTEN